jgi:hypothetical protein
LACFVKQEVLGIVLAIGVATAFVGLFAALVTLTVVPLNLLLANDKVIREGRGGR